MEQDNFPEFIIVHHSGGTNADPLADTSHHTLEIIDAYHKSLGWEGFGYHYLIEKDGTLRKGRPETYHGAHTKGYNEKSVGICLAGNFDAFLPTEEQINTLRGLLKDVCNRYSIPLEKIVPHRTFAVKSCYGSKLSDDWARSLLTERNLKQEITNKIGELQTLVDLLE